MKVRKAVCPGCHAPIKFPKNRFGTCEYCGIHFFLDGDEFVEQGADLSRYPVTENSYGETKAQEFTEGSEQYAASYQKWKKTMLFWLIALGASYFLSANAAGGLFGSLFGAILVFGGIAMIVTKPKKSLDGSYKGYQSDDYEEVSPKSRLAALLLCLFFGVFGIHSFYVGRIGRGLLFLFTFGLFGIGVIIDLIMIIAGTFKDSEERLLKN